ncbi:YkgJ family cysteine cluster protein [Kordia zhangzhouensis]|uniref:YkgJ family cysteine cluster protein n=1 Tax=Kordia zhangzhouensis TaxID=1620405 RepID=UPI000629912E|nr:YkgJ family cysteine cluster protein [Kordia zhangzhouensis]
MQDFINELPKLAKEAEKENRKFFHKLRKKTPKNLDYLMQELHEEEFAQTDCLACANCCKTTSPIFTNADIARISKHFRMKEHQFISQFLYFDEDNHYVLQSAPCHFLGADNECMIYDVRPKACREYPHTDRKKFHKISDITINNTAICPATYRIVEKLKVVLEGKAKR